MVASNKVNRYLFNTEGHLKQLQTNQNNLNELFKKQKANCELKSWLQFCFEYLNLLFYISDLLKNLSPPPQSRKGGHSLVGTIGRRLLSRSPGINLTFSPLSGRGEWRFFSRYNRRGGIVN